jgi:phosphoenolpyruvate synthase/pyruvate phosphate dikinase
MKRLQELRKADTIYGAKAANLGELTTLGEDLGFYVPYGVVVRECDDYHKIYDKTELLGPPVIVRSSFAGEDGPNKSFAGEFTSIVTDIEGVEDAIKQVFSCEPYRAGRSVIVQEYIEAKYSGEYFTYNPDNGDCPTLWSSIKGNGGTVDGMTTLVKRPAAPARFEILGQHLVIHFSRHLDIEWVIDENDRLYLVQARPLTAYASRKKKILTGLGILNEFVPKAMAMVIMNPEKWAGPAPSTPYILVAPHTNRRWEMLMRGAAGLITDHGTNTCHAAIFSREIGLPAVIGTLNATRDIRIGDMLYLDTLTKPGTGIVYKEDFD